MYAKPLSHAEALGPGCAGPALALPPSAADAMMNGGAGAGAAASSSMQRPTSGAAAFAVSPHEVASSDDPRQRTQYPYVTGTSVLGLVFDGGVMLASDTLGSYGSTKRYKSFPRLFKANETTLVGAGGELSDFQYLQDLLDELSADDFCADDGLRRSPAALCSYLTRVLYNRRSKFDPLWNSLVVAGVDQANGGKPFLGAVSMLGVKYEDGHVATGFGAHLARPLFRERHSPDMSRADAEALMREALAVCYYRDKQSINKFQIATVTVVTTAASTAAAAAAAAPPAAAAGDGGKVAVEVEVGEPFALATEWGYGAFVHPSAHAVGTW